MEHLKLFAGLKGLQSDNIMLSVSNRQSQIPTDKVRFSNKIRFLCTKSDSHKQSQILMGKSIFINQSKIIMNKIRFSYTKSDSYRQSHILIYKVRLSYTMSDSHIQSQILIDKVRFSYTKSDSYRQSQILLYKVRFL